MTDQASQPEGLTRPLPAWSDLGPSPDQPLPEVATPEREPGIRTPTSTSPARPPRSTSPAPSGEPDTTLPGRSPRTGDAREVGKVIAGLVKLLTGIVAKLAAGRGLVFRRPTDVETNDIGQPLGRIVARHADISGVSPDVADAASATAAVSEYLLSDEPLLTRAPEAWRPPETEDPAP